MANLQVKNLPDELHRALKRLARARGCAIRDLVLDAVRREVEKEAFTARLRRRAPVDLGQSAAELLTLARSERAKGLAKR